MASGKVPSGPSGSYSRAGQAKVLNGLSAFSSSFPPSPNSLVILSWEVSPQAATLLLPPTTFSSLPSDLTL